MSPADANAPAALVPLAQQSWYIAFLAELDSAEQKPTRNAMTRPFKASKKGSQVQRGELPIKGSRG